MRRAFIVLVAILACGPSREVTKDHPTPAGVRAAVTNASFARSVVDEFHLRAPAHVVRFSDVKRGTPNYELAQAIAPHLHRQVLCPTCLLRANFWPDRPITRVEASIVLVSVLVAEKRVGLVSTAEAQRILEPVSDARGLPKYARPYIATAIKHRLVELRGGELKPHEHASPEDLQHAIETARKGG